MAVGCCVYNGRLVCNKVSPMCFWLLISSSNSWHPKKPRPYQRSSNRTLTLIQKYLTLEFPSPLTITYLVSEAYNPETMLNCFELSSVRLLGSYVMHHPSSLISYVPK